MTKEKVTLTLNSQSLAELRTLVGSRSLSATIDSALAKHLAHLRHLTAVDEWLAEMEAEHGPVPQETLEWAAQIFDAWESDKSGSAASGREAV